MEEGKNIFLLPGYEVPKDAMYLQTEKLIEDTFEKAGYDFVRFSEIDFGKIPRQTAEGCGSHDD